ncbi:hypothetical protein scyTo_0013712 [Scyliorhinus torazame]|uniref:Uncharacterized protein n=1 Tax=Scyliorhinus torazame TaxID=75743 RepID=A0A401P322_SCYTO|nr:hypothetical protein [Scyliorhinus torazame]
MDLISDLERMTDFPRQKSYFIISSEEKTRNQKNRNVVFGHGFDSDDDIPSPPVTQAPILMPSSTGHLSGSVRPDSSGFNEHRSQKGLDHYLDSLFDPVLSYENGDLERSSLLSARMKGGGKVGAGNGDDAPLNPVKSMEIPGAHQDYDPSQLNAQQQDFINQQAYLLTNAANKDPAQSLISHNAAKGKPPVNRPKGSVSCTWDRETTVPGTERQLYLEQRQLYLGQRDNCTWNRDNCTWDRETTVPRTERQLYLGQRDNCTWDRETTVPETERQLYLRQRDNCTWDRETTVPGTEREATTWDGERDNSTRDRETTVPGTERQLYLELRDNCTWNRETNVPGTERQLYLGQRER